MLVQTNTCDKPRMRWNLKWNKWFWASSHGMGPVDSTPMGECLDCRVLAPMGKGRCRCRGCSSARYERRRKIAGPAHARVFAAIRRGDLPPASSLKCADCGGNAEHYDHRCYAKPLEVDPVCNRCNKKRGPAMEIELLILKGL